MIAQKLYTLAVKAAEEEQKVKRKSEKARISEELGEIALTLFQEPDVITDAEKIAAFDKLRDMLIGNLIHATRSGIRGDGYRGYKDHAHYVYEMAMKECLGQHIFDGVNILSRMLGEF